MGTLPSCQIHAEKTFAHRRSNYRGLKNESDHCSGYFAPFTSPSPQEGPLTSAPAGQPRNAAVLAPHNIC
jgi:hypothetical protein